MKRVTVLLSRNDRLTFIQNLQTKYAIGPKDVENVKNIATMGVGYLQLRISSNETIILEFISDNPNRHGSAKVIESYIKNAKGVIVTSDIPELFKPYLNKEHFVFDYKNDTDVSDLMESITATPTPNEADALIEEQAAPAAAPSVFTTLWGLFKTDRKATPIIKVQEALKRSEEVQAWQNDEPAQNAAGSVVRPNGGRGNDDL